MKKTLRSYGFVPPMVAALVFAFALTASADTGSSGDEDNFIVNGDFSDSNIPADLHEGKYGKGNEGVSTASWTIGDGAGLTTSDSAWLTKVYSEPYAVLMQREWTTSFISQDFSVPDNGRYRLSFRYKGRDVYSPGIGYQMAVAIDGEKIKTVTTRSTTYWQYGTADIELTAGEHSLKFYGAREYTDISQQGDITIILDDVSLRQIRNFVANGDFSDSYVPDNVNGGTWGIGSSKAFAEPWVFGNNAGLTMANTTWRSTVYSAPYSAVIHAQTANSWLSQTVTVPVDGKYSFSFWYIGRPGYNTGYRMLVSMDGVDIARAVTFTADVWSQIKANVTLTAGTHVLKFYSEEDSTIDRSVIIDDVILEMASDIRSAVWTGNGDPNNAFGEAANWRCYDENGNLLAGKVPDSQTSEVTLAADADWSKVPASQLTMASLNLDGHNLKIAGNGTLTTQITVSSGENYIKNGDFTVAENLTRDDGTWGWAGEATNPVTAEPWELGRNTGITAKGSPWTTKVFSEPYSAYIQKEYNGYSSLSQTVTVPAAGRYRLSFCYVGRDMHETTVGYKLAVSLGDQHLTSVTTTTCSAWSYCATEVELTQGSHELKLYGESQYDASVTRADCSVIVDDIELRPAGECCLTVEVPEGVDFNNSKLNLKGDIKLVKTGAGTLTASSAAAQMYTGGTTVEAGVLKLNASGSKYPLGAAKDMPVIRVAAGAKFDLNGKYDLNGYQFIVAGGKLANTGGDMPADSASLPSKCSIHQMTLEADSSLDSSRNFLFRGNSGGVIDLGGHTLTATMAGGKTLFLCNSMQNGRLLFNTPEAIFYVGNGGSGEISLSETDFDIYGKLAINTSVSVRNWTVRSPVGEGLSSRDATVSVTGAFAPVTDYFCNTLLLDGATLDLSERSTALDVKSLDTANDKDYRLSFADNAHVMVDFGERRFREQVKVVDWTPDTKPSNLATLKFKASPENRYRSRLVVTEEGISACPADGMRIIVR